MRRLAFIITAVLMVLVVGPLVLHRYRISQFLAEVRMGLRANGEDPSSVDTFGYPDGFMKHKIRKGEVRNRQDVRRLMQGYERFQTEIEDGNTIDIYVFRVGIIPFDDPVVFVFRPDGTFVGMPIDGASWK